MNYLKQYIKLVRRAEARAVPACYTERHHIFPISIFGKNPRTVRLTFKEHLVAHHLLFKTCLKRYGPTHNRTIRTGNAFFCMICFSSRGDCPKAVAIASYIKKAKPPKRAITTTQREALRQYMLINKPFVGDKNPNYDKTARNWSNLIIGITELNITTHELCQKYPNLTSNVLGLVVRGEILQYKGWFISETRDKFSQQMYPKLDVSILTWVNKELGAVEHNTTIQRLKAKYPHLRTSSLKAVIRGEAIQTHGWEILKDSSNIS